MRTLGGIPGVVKADLDFLLRRFDTKGDGRVSLFALMQWAGIKCMSTAGVENAVSVFEMHDSTRLASQCFETLRIRLDLDSKDA